MKNISQKVLMIFYFNGCLLPVHILSLHWHLSSQCLQQGHTDSQNSQPMHSARLFVYSLHHKLGTCHKGFPYLAIISHVSTRDSVDSAQHCDSNYTNAMSPLSSLQWHTLRQIALSANAGQRAPPTLLSHALSIAVQKRCGYVARSRSAGPP